MLDRVFFSWKGSAALIFMGSNLFAQISVSLAPCGTGDILVTMENLSEQNRSILRRNTPINGVEADLFCVENSRGLIDYIGKLKHHLNPFEGDWFTLKARQSVSVKVDLKKYYAMNPGKYLVKFDAPIVAKIADYDDMEDVSEIQVTSNSVPVIVEDKYINNDSHEFSLQTDFKGFSDMQEFEIRASFSQGLKLALDASNRVLTENVSSNCVSWFGNCSSEKLDIIYNNFYNIYRAFGEKWTFHAGENEAGLVAYVFAHRPHEIWISNAFFDRSMNDISRGSYLMHEATHWKNTIGTKDFGSSIQLCKSFADSNNVKAVSNAENYRQYSLSQISD